MNNRTQLIRNGYAVTDDTDVIDTHKTPDARWSQTHMALIRIDAPKDFTTRVFAAADEPAAIVGVSPTSAVALFKVIDGDRYDMATYPHFRKEERHEFVLPDGKKQGLFTVTSTEQTIDPALFTWRDGRSPLTTRRDELPQLFLDVHQRVYKALDRFLKEAGGRFGPLVVPETPIERFMRERAERKAAGVVETPVDADERAVAANPDLRPSDGHMGVLVDEARKRISKRKSAA